MNKQLEALIAKIKKQTESFDTVVLKEDEAAALIAALEQAEQQNSELLALREAGKEPVGTLIGEGTMFKPVADLFAFKAPGCREWSFTEYAESIPEMVRRGWPVKEYVTLERFQQSYAAPQLPTVPEYPELLPYPVLLEPGFRFGKGVPTSSMLGALKRCAERQAELDAMSPEAKAEYDASIEKLKSVLMPDGAEQRLAAAVALLKQAAPHMLADESLKDPGGALCGKRRAVPDGWSESASVNAITVMLDRIETIDPADDDRIEEIKGLVRILVAMKIPVAPDGWVMVPKQLTQEMRNAWDSAPYTDDDDEDMRGAYGRMIAAAPKPE